MSWWYYFKTSYYIESVAQHLNSCSLQIHITGTKLSEDSRKYGSENTCTSGSTLSKAAITFGKARAQMEKEHGILLKALGTQVCTGHPLVRCRWLLGRIYFWIITFLNSGNRAFQFTI